MIRMMVTAALLLVVAPAFAAETAKPSEGKKVEIKVTEDGFRPQQVKAKKGEPITLVFTRVTDSTCITAVDIPDEDVKELELPLKKPVSIKIAPKKAGVETFHCSAMGMGDGKIVVSE